MILFLHGPDTYRSRKRLQFYKDGFQKKYDTQGLNIQSLDGARLTMTEFRNAVGAVGFLAKKRLVVVENIFSGKKQKRITHEIAEYLASEWPDEHVLVFWQADEKTKRGRTPSDPLYARLLKEKEEYFPLLTDQELQRWVLTEVKRRGGQIEQPAILELTSFVGPDLWQLDHEIEKLTNYRQGNAITADDVRLFVSARFDENIFHLTDALSQKDAHLALKLINDQLELGVHELYILTMLVRQFRILLQVKEILQQDRHASNVATTLGLHPFVVQKALRDTQRFRLDDLKAIYGMLLDLDVKIKTTQENPETLFDVLVVRICERT